MTDVLTEGLALLREAFGDFALSPDLYRPENLSHLLSPGELFSRMGEELHLLLPSLSRFAVLLFLLSVGAILLKNLLPSPGGPGETGLLLAVGLVLSGFLFQHMEHFFSWLTDLSRLSLGLSTVYVGLYSAGGSHLSGLSAGGGFGLFSGIVSALSQNVLSPLLRILGVFTLFSAFGDSPFAPITKTVKSWVSTLFGLFSALFPSAVALETALKASSDSFAFKTAKYAFGAQIPLVGGALSSSLGSLLAALRLLRETAGGLGFFLYFTFTLPPILELFCVKGLLSLFSGVGEGLSSPGISRLLSSFKQMYDLLFAFALSLSACFLLLITLLSLLPFALD